MSTPSPTPGWYVDLTSVETAWPGGLLVLMYHAVETPPLRHGLRGLYVEPALLRTQLEELRASGARFTSLSEWNRRRSREREIVVTFDDGFQSAHREALPILCELGIPAINYIVAGELGGTNAWDRAIGAQMRPLMSRGEILDWLSSGLEIGAHTVSHPRLATLTEAQARHEIFDGKKMLEDLCGRPVPHFAYPYGDWNPAIRDLVAEAGYETAVVAQAGFNSFESDSYTLQRFFARHRSPGGVALLRAFQKLTSKNKHTS